jgi:phosphatidylglycerol---prolipoprotein diacylglyceryl transferase
MVRKRFKTPLKLFGFYLILNGLERFFIEKMKVNYKYDWGFIHPAQSEIISFALIVSGILILLLYRFSPNSTRAGT